MALVAGQIPVSGYRQPDYSGAAAASAVAQAAPYQMISDLAGQAKDYFKQQGEQKKLIKQSGLQIDAALQLFPDLAPTLGGLKERMKDENVPVADRAAEAEVVANLINMSMGEMRNRADMSYKQQQAMSDAIFKQQQLGMEERRTQASEYKAAQSGRPSYEIKKATITLPGGQAFEKDMPFNPKTGRFFDEAAGKEIQDINKWGSGEPSYVEDMQPTSQIGGGSSDLIAQVAEMNIGKPISAKTLGTQGGKLGCADAVCKLVKQATGEEIGTLSTSEMVSRLSKNPKFETVPIGQAQRGDIIVTPRGKSAGHAGVFLDGGAIASNSSAGFNGGSPGTLQQNYTLGTWMNSIDSRNPGKTQVFRYTGGGDMTAQAMGTPEQQAQIASMIAQSAGMQTAQYSPSGAMPTEARMAQPQQAPQQEAPRVRPGFVPVGGKDQKQVKVVSGQDAKTFGLDPLGTYKVQVNPDGSLADVSSISAPPTAMQKQEAATKNVEQQQMAESIAEKSDRMVTLLQELKGHEGFSRLFGTTWLSPGIAGTKGAGAKALFKQVEAMGFMEAIKDMKGMGALSDAEGQRASAAFLGIDPDMPEEEAKKKIDEVISFIQKGQSRISAGGLVNPDGSSKPAVNKGTTEANNYFNQFKP